MCAIFGSTNLEMFLHFADLNSYRGQHSFSITQFDKNSNILSLRKELGLFDKEFIPDESTYYFLGHIQAPTTQVSGIHPCEKNNKKLWHNGIIKQHVLDAYSWTGWDTEFLIDNLDNLSNINGSFACALYQDNLLHFFRNEISPLFFDEDYNISSTKFPSSLEVPPNKIWKIDFNEIPSRISTVINTFSTLENPYYFN